MTDRSGRTYDEYRELYWAEKKVVKLLRKDIAVLVTTIEELEAEVKEWLCVSCNYVYPGPPQQGAGCVVCPKCGGKTMPKHMARIAELETEKENFRVGFIREGCRNAELETKLGQAKKRSQFWKDNHLAGNKIIAELEAAIKPDCEWTQEDVDCNEWLASCGYQWVFEADGPKQNRMNFCPSCGGKLIALEQKS